MARASFGGTLTIGSLALRLQAFPVAKEERSPAPRWLHRKDQGPLQEGTPRCTLCWELVTDEEAVRGVESPKGYVLLEDAEIKQIKPVRDEMGIMTVQEFVPIPSIDARWAEKTYYVSPKGPEDLRLYSLLARVLWDERVVAVTTYISYGRHRLAVVGASGPRQGLTLTQLYFVNEIREPKDYGIDFEPIPLARDEIVLARRVVQSRTRAFRHATYEDEGRNHLLALIASKADGRKFVAPVPATPHPPKIAALLEALQASVALKGTKPMTTKPVARAARARG